MAKVTIELTDQEDGNVNMVLDSDPAWPAEDAEQRSLTVAQALALRVIRYIQQLALAIKDVGEQ